MRDDKRMYFIRNLEALKNVSADSDVVEYEVITDAHIVGEFTYGPYYFTIWEFSDKPPGQDRKLCLRIREKSASPNDEPWKTATTSGFYHGGGIADELLALAALFFRRRFKLGPIVRMGDNPCLLPVRRGWIDQALIAGGSNLGELLEALKLAEALDDSYHQRFILAVRLYHRAVQVIEEQPDMAYLNLVSAIEVLCQEVDVGEITLSDIDGELAACIDSVADADLRGKITDRIIKRERFIRRRFVKFILDNLEESFWTRSERPQHGRVDSEQLPALLNRIYDQRSRTLHNGEPFPASILSPPLQGAEIDVALGVIVGEKKWEPGDFIPYPHFFERLVNHVLRTFLKKNQAKTGEA